MTPISAPSKQGLTINRDWAISVVGEIFEDYRRQVRLFRYIGRKDAPQTIHRPEDIRTGSITHARWLFFAAMTDRREISDRVYAGHKQLWAQHAELLYERPILPFCTTTTDIAAILSKQGIGMPETSAQSWMACSATLFEKLNGNPANLYRGKSIDDIVSFKQTSLHLPGFGPKLLSLLALFYTELDLIELPKDAFPVDVHVQRIALSTGIIESDRTISNAYLEKTLRPLLSDICNEQGWPVLEVAHALWFLGNQLCTDCSLTAEAATYCPAYQQCGGAVNSRNYFKKGTWDTALRYPRSGQRPFCLPDDAPLFD